MPETPDPNYVPALAYHWLTPFYDVVVRATTRERRFKQALIRQARFAPGQRVLDLASGTGTLAIRIKRDEPRLDVTGVDIDPDILARASCKARTAQELFRVLKPGGELHVADWGRPANRVMRGLYLMVQCLDGFETTRDNVAGRLVGLFEDAGFVDVAQRQTFSTILGTLALYRAVKPASGPAAKSLDSGPMSRL